MWTGLVGAARHHLKWVASEPTLMNEPSGSAGLRFLGAIHAPQPRTQRDREVAALGSALPRAAAPLRQRLHARPRARRRLCEIHRARELPRAAVGPRSLLAGIYMTAAKAGRLCPVFEVRSVPRGLALQLGIRVLREFAGPFHVKP